MIPLDYITTWRLNAPWPQLSQIEQHLIICRALVELYIGKCQQKCRSF